MSNTHLIGGVVLGLALGAGAYYGADTYLLAGAQPCRGLCTEGTVCTPEGACAPPEAEPEAELEPEAEDENDKKGKRRRRGKRGKRGGAGEGEGEPGSVFDDDSHVPGFDANADQDVSMSDGSGRLSDSVVNAGLAKLDKKFQSCVLEASGRVDDLGTGTVRYSFGIDGKGKVTGVNVTTPSKFSQAGMIPCVRNAIFAHHFPAFDGPTMRVKSSFSVD